jgi:two-component system sensor histidine kinase DegS
MAATVAVEQPGARLPKHIEVALFRIIQEAVNNIARHSSANRAQIHLGFNGGRANLRISDDGRGFDTDRVLGPDAPVTSTGLLGMQERVKLLNGTIDIRSQVGRGTEILVDVPIR